VALCPGLGLLVCRAAVFLCTRDTLMLNPNPGGVLRLRVNPGVLILRRRGRPPDLLLTHTTINYDACPSFAKNTPFL